MRRLIALVVLAGCAQASVPPGGPPDTNPPRLVRVSPDTNALNVRGNAITFQFDEVVSERPQGAQDLAGLFVVSPSTGPSGISWRRTRVDVRPRGGLRPNTTYRVQMLPGMVDLDNNVDSAGVTLVFSTGPAIATGRIAGRAFDWAAARPAARALVEAITLPDSARYATNTDSSGAFALTNMPPGRYLLRALVDQNNNAEVDARELFDTMTVTLVDSLRRELLAAVRDTLGVGIATADMRDSVTLRLALDRPLDTLFVPTASIVSIQAADSSAVPFTAVITQADEDRRIADSTRAKAVQDSVRAAFIRDSARVADSVRTAAAGPPVRATEVPPPRPTGRRPGATNVPPRPAQRDTTDRTPPKPSAKIPVAALYVKFAQPLRPNTSYRVTATGLRSVTGATRTSSRVFTTPRARGDTSRTRPDTGRTSRE